RGPIVYCLEWPDNDGRVRNLILPPATALEADFQPQLLNGVTTITGTGYNLIADDQKQITHAPAKFTAIPYYTWANRGRGEMEVWIPTSDQAGHVRRPPTLSSSSKITLSHPGNDLGAINDQLAPNNDSSKNNGFFGGQDEPFFHWWPRKGTAEWVQYEFSKPAKVSSAAVYWFDDTGRGECRVPANWQVLYRVAGQWQPVSTTNSYGVKPNQFNHINFAPVQTDALRLQVQLQEKWSTGIYEWQVE
ncbi:MAG TPA: glycoside hydrolase family 127 protein, partial [Verrucomicrobiae bacterium]